MAQTLYRRLNLARGSKPLGVFCFAGPPGVGKTLFAKVLADKLTGGRTALLHVDMSQYTQPQGAQQLFGAPRGYVGSESYGTLTAKLRDCPHGIILLDEFEKAHESVQKRFLTAWNDGFVTEASNGDQVSSREAIFIVTTNAAGERVGELAIAHADDPDSLRRALVSALQQAGIAPELLNRIDAIIGFAPLRGLDVARVVALEIEQLLGANGLQLVGGGIAPAILVNAIQRNERLGGSVRDVVRAIEVQLSDAVIAARRQGAELVALRDREGELEIEIQRVGYATSQNANTLYGHP